MFFIKLFSLNESHYCFYIFLHFTTEQKPCSLSASHKDCCPASLPLLVSPNLTTHDIPPRWCHSHSWYGPGIYLKMSVSPPPVSACARRGGDREERVRRSTAVQINECTIGGWVSSPLPVWPTACTNCVWGGTTCMQSTHTHTCGQYAWSKFCS